MLVRFVAPAILISLAACNTPPLYQQRARAFLQRQGVAGEVVRRLTTRQPLEPGVAARLAQYDNVAVLHLVGANPGTPAEIV